MTPTIVRDIAAAWDVTEADMKRKRGTWKAAEARFVYMFHLRHVYGHSLVEVGHRAGGYDHATVIHALKQVANRAIYDKLFYSRLKLLGLTAWITTPPPGSLTR